MARFARAHGVTLDVMLLGRCIQTRLNRSIHEQGTIHFRLDGQTVDNSALDVLTPMVVHDLVPRLLGRGRRGCLVTHLLGRHEEWSNHFRLFTLQQGHDESMIVVCGLCWAVNNELVVDFFWEMTFVLERTCLVRSMYQRKIVMMGHHHEFSSTFERPLCSTTRAYSRTVAFAPTRSLLLDCPHPFYWFVQARTPLLRKRKGSLFGFSSARNTYNWINCMANETCYSFYW